MGGGLVVGSEGWEVGGDLGSFVVVLSSRLEISEEGI